VTAWDYKVLTLCRKPDFTESLNATVPDDESLLSTMAPLGAQDWEWVCVLRAPPTLALPCSSSARAERVFRSLAGPTTEEGR